MQASNVPAKIQVPFANSGSKRTIPIPSQIGITGGAASYTDGFPPLTMTPLAGGGIPPAGQDFNGILNAITLIQQWQAAGGSFSYDATWSTANNGYPKGAVLLQAGGQGFWLCTTDNNTSNPDTGTPTGWAPLDAVGITAVAGLTNANVTLTPAQYGLPIITLAGTLTGNVQIIFPAIAGTQWLIVNNTTGNFTLTAKTSAGTGVVLASGSTTVFGDGTNINGSSSGRFLSRQVIISTATITPPAGASFGDCVVVAGGGGGGGTTSTGAGQAAAGAGGGGGGWARKKIAASALSGLTATVGAGGSGGVGAAGGNGGASSIGALLTASAGGGGSLGSASSTLNVPQGSGAPGIGASGDVNYAGGTGNYAFYAATPSSGRGGSSYGGDGAGWVTGTFLSGNSAPAAGAGGSGSVSANGAALTTGGAGFQGVIIIDWYQ